MIVNKTSSSGQNSLDRIFDSLADERYVDFMASGVHLRSLTYDESLMSDREFTIVMKYLLELCGSEEEFIDHRKTIKKLRAKLPEPVLALRLFKITVMNETEYISFQHPLLKRKAIQLLGDDPDEREERVYQALEDLRFEV
jgi:hypothetical protein